MCLLQLNIHRREREILYIERYRRKDMWRACRTWRAGEGGEKAEAEMMGLSKVSSTWERE